MPRQDQVPPRPPVPAQDESPARMHADRGRAFCTKDQSTKHQALGHQAHRQRARSLGKSSQGRQRGLKGKEPLRVVPDPMASPAHTEAAGMPRRLPAAASPQCSPRLLSHTIASPGRMVPRRMLGCATWLPRAEVSPVPAGLFTGL